jgi:hypothetical protein
MPDFVGILARNRFSSAHFLDNSRHVFFGSIFIWCHPKSQVLCEKCVHDGLFLHHCFSRQKVMSEPSFVVSELYHLGNNGVVPIQAIVRVIEQFSQNNKSHFETLLNEDQQLRSIRFLVFTQIVWLY